MISTRIYKMSAILAVAAALAGCGDLASDGIASQALQGLGALGKRQAPADPRQGLTRDALDNAPIRLVYVEIPKFPSQATLQEVARNRNQITWLSVDGISVTFEQGFLVATRGYGEDIMGADIAASKAAIRRGSGQNLLRVHDYLDGSDDIQRRSFLCDISALGAGSVRILSENVSVRSYSERCSNPELSFENRYDFGRDGRLVASRQWVSPSVGYMVTQELSR